MDKIFQVLIACNSLYGLGALALICITLVIGISQIKTVLLESIKTYNSVHAKINGASIKTEIDLQGKAA